jgi:hypothetical protein
MRLVAAAILLAAPAAAQEAQSAPGAVLRLLDKIAGTTVEIDIGRGQVVTQGRLAILLDDCRYRGENPGSDAWAHLVIRDSRLDTPVFAGWMSSASPALSALDHARYDVWLVRCATE